MGRINAWTPALLILGAMLLDEALPGLLHYERAAILEDGQLWRMLSGHWVHASWLHCAMNIAALLLLQTLEPSKQPIQETLMGMLIMALATSVLLLILVPDLAQYTGFSAVLHGLWAQSGIRRLGTPQRWQGAMMLALLMAKLLAEYGGNTSGQWSGLRVIPESHLLGAIAGVLIASLKKPASCNGYC